MDGREWTPGLPRRVFCWARELAMPGLCPVCRAAPVKAAPAVCPNCTDRLRELPAPRCAACGGANDGILAQCGECLRAERRPWSVAVSVYGYGGEIREVIQRFKYQGHVWLAPFLADRMCRNWKQYGAGSPDVTVPIPMHRIKELWRGYNQAELLARQVSLCLGVPLAAGLVRVGWQRQQARLRFEQRQTNVKRAFRVTTADKLVDRHILLVDDVFTTGATLMAAATALRSAGVRQVSVLTLARG